MMMMMVITMRLVTRCDDADDDGTRCDNADDDGTRCGADDDYGDDDDDDDDGDQVWSGGAVAGCHGKSPTPPCTASTGD